MITPLIRFYSIATWASGYPSNMKVQEVRL
jgi:hypothetical protein